MKLSIKTIMSVLKVLNFMITVRPVGLSEMPAITSVSTFISLFYIYIVSKLISTSIHLNTVIMTGAAMKETT